MILILTLLVRIGATYRIAFGSCIKQYRSHENDVFKRIGEFQPDVFLWLGDAAYVDVFKVGLRFAGEPNETKIIQKFNATKNDKYYQEFRKNVPIFGVYDDHDYNQNDGDRHNPLKEIAKQKYLDFLDIPKNSPLRKQNGIYQSFSLGKNIKVIMTDGRYNRDVETGDMLGQEQWIWLEEQLKQKFKLFIITSGVQVMPDDRKPAEKWLPESLKRLYELIDKYRAPTIFLSGDVHFSEIMRYPCPNRYGKTMYELTSSGLTEGNSEVIPFIDIVFDFLFPPTYNDQDKQFYGANFGIVDVYADQYDEITKVVLRAISADNSSTMVEQNILYSDIEFHQNRLNKEHECILDHDKNNRFIDNFMKKIHVHLRFVIALVSFVIGLIFISCIILVKWLKVAIQIYYDD